MSIDEDKSRDECAQEWMIRLDTATPEEQAAFHAWLGESLENVLQFIEVLKGHYEIDEAVAQSKVLTQMVEEARKNAASPKRARWGIAASAVLATMLIGWSVLFKPNVSDVIVTDAGEWKRMTLEDGSILFAAPRTRLLIQFTDERRRIRLDQGDAMFHVATDSKRPFVVESIFGSARAVGTAFSTSLDDGRRFRVDVQHGLVAVAQHDYEGAHPNSETVTLKGGEEVVVTRDGVLAPIEVDIEVTMAWTTRRLVFKNHTVEQAVREFNRLNKLQIHVLDPALRRHMLSGSFDAADPESFIAYLERQGGVKVDYNNPDTVLIVPKSDIITMEASK